MGFGRRNGVLPSNSGYSAAEAGPVGANRLACRLWAIVAALVAWAFFQSGAWVSGVFMLVHAFVVWPECIGFCHVRGWDRRRVMSAWISLVIVVLVYPHNPMNGGGGSSSMEVAGSTVSGAGSQVRAESAGPAKGGQAASSATASGPSIETVWADSPRRAFLILKAKQEIEAVLRDPTSARYRGVMAVRVPKANGAIFCGEVNARNGFGGFTGYERFISVPTFGAFTKDTPGFEATWNELCRNDRVLGVVAF